MNAMEAYRRISSWPDDRFGSIGDDSMAECFRRNRHAAGIRFRPLLMAAAVVLSGQLSDAKCDDDLLGCVKLYDQMIRDSQTSCQQLQKEMAVLMAELNPAALRAHELN